MITRRKFFNMVVGGASLLVSGISVSKGVNDLSESSREKVNSYLIDPDAWFIRTGSRSIKSLGISWYTQLPKQGRIEGLITRGWVPEGGCWQGLEQELIDIMKLKDDRGLVMNTTSPRKK